MNTSTTTVTARMRPVIILLLSLLVAIPVLAFLDNPFQLLLERHSFRQTQTALTSYWLLRGGEFFNYLTPVLGDPWSVPLELPMFQGLVAVVSSVFGVPLDFAGRLVSSSFFLLTAIPIALCLRRYGWCTAIIAIALLFTSPVNLFYSRAFLIETTATFLALGALCLYIGFIRTGRNGFLIAFVFCGTLAGLQKITTFLPVFGVCCLDLLHGNYRNVLKGTWRAIDPRPILAVGGAMLLPASWSLYSDMLKEAGSLSALMTAGRLTDFTFGTLAQRLDLSTWLLIFYDRLFLYGGLGVGMLLLALAALRKKALFGREAALFAGAGLLGPLVFFNLHWVHDYYQLGCIAFFACAIAVAVSPYVEEVLATAWPRFALAVLVILATNYHFFQQRYAHLLRSEPTGSQVAYQVATWVKERQAERDVVVVFGMNWSATIPYYAGRYGLAVPEDAPQRAELVSNPRAFTGDREIGSIVYCRHKNRPLAERKHEMETLFQQLDGPSATFSHCTVKLRGAPASSVARSSTSPVSTSDR